ncbi:MAG: aldehyde ferredoxin oxidoreductase family protein [Chloroflexi bacterium]|nr:aldehyde ferredoxin oxidoreductase family protein [Chloroflexota bacterium]MBI3732778.1 aldehyde ferredoxin oxidoreductase family protein [Chloroflexota bacterium]
MDLSVGKLWTETPDESFYRTYMGGSAMGIYYVLKHTPAKVDPLSPQNVLTFFVGAPTGVPISGQSRVSVNAKSPLTGAIGDSQAGGYWPAEMKFAGFDGFVFYGKSPKPVYLWANSGVAELRDASHLWGHVTGDVDRILKAELGDKDIEIMQIGPAGEHQVRFSAVMNMSNRAAGRTGMGAVMGSKNLKAVVVRGHEKVKVADPKGLNALHKSGAKLTTEEFTFGKLGTSGIVTFQNAGGGLPTFNYDSGHFEHAHAISGQVMFNTMLKKRETCFACVVRCKRVVEDEQRAVNPYYGGPEYETLATFGSYCGIGDLSAVAKANELCNKFGADTISAGATMAFAMDCYTHGLITQADTGGLDLSFGNADNMLKMLEMTFHREGFGDVLADGSAKAAQRIGKGAEALAVTVKGQELPAHMPQVKRSLALIYSVNPFGADHESSEHDSSYTPKSDAHDLGFLAQIGLAHPQERRVLNEEKVKFAYVTQQMYSLLDTIAMCHFVFGPGWQLYGPNDLLRTMQAVTGWNDLTLEELLAAGERRLNLMRAFNAREGIGRDHDTLPDKMFKPLKGGRSDGATVDRDEWLRALDTYYRMAGWDVETGMPTRHKLNALGLAWVADELSRSQPLAA